MKNTLLFLLLLTVGIACTSSEQAPDLATMGKDIYDEKTNKFDKPKTLEFIKVSEKYVANHPQDSSAIKHLFKAASMARAIQEPQKAIEIYDKIYTNYSSSSKAAQALFLKGFILENELKQADKAKAIYEDFLAKHPNNDFAKDARFLLQNLGKSNEEIIQSFEKPAQESKK